MTRYDGKEKLVQKFLGNLQVKSAVGNLGFKYEENLQGSTGVNVSIRPRPLGPKSPFFSSHGIKCPVIERLVVL
jgi:hypothetical protein